MPRLIRRSAILAAALACTAQAADWSDTALSYRYGTRYAEPFNPRDITKHIFNFSHVAGHQYGKNFLIVDCLLSSRDDPASADGGRAREVYLVYRHTLDLGKLSGRKLAFGPVRGVGASVGFDLNRKNDAGYNSRKRMLVAGPTLMLDVPGFLDISLLAMWESNAPSNDYSGRATPRYRYRTHPMLNAAWNIPFHAGVPLEFSGYANLIGAKGRNEFGGGTAPETNIDAQLMYDLGAAAGAGKNTFKVGVAYQYWRNKFGNPGKHNPGATARTPMLRAEYHF
jgi:nucleoside-specific outer membrane channel protein Tsx